jgi:hypothetical protein
MYRRCWYFFNFSIKADLNDIITNASQNSELFENAKQFVEDKLVEFNTKIQEEANIYKSEVAKKLVIQGEIEQLVAEIDELDTDITKLKESGATDDNEVLVERSAELGAKQLELNDKRSDIENGLKSTLDEDLLNELKSEIETDWNTQRRMKYNTRDLYHRTELGTVLENLCKLFSVNPPPLPSPNTPLYYDLLSIRTNLEKELEVTNKKIGVLQTNTKETLYKIGMNMDHYEQVRVNFKQLIQERFGLKYSEQEVVDDDSSRVLPPGVKQYSFNDQKDFGPDKDDHDDFENSSGDGVSWKNDVSEMKDVELHRTDQNIQSLPLKSSLVKSRPVFHMNHNTTSGLHF